MTKKVTNRIKSFIWRAGLFTVVAVAGYLSNIKNIKEVDISVLVTIFVTTLAVFIANEGTKYINSAE